jgi:GNAT superfamily N-acetyltransferase
MKGQPWKKPMDGDQVLIGEPVEMDVGPVEPGSAEGRAVLAAYFHEVVSRHHGREATAAEAAGAMRAEPSDDLRPPGGVLLVARQDGRILGCAGLRLLPAGTGEVTRVFVVPQARRRGIGQYLLDAVEVTARQQQVTRLRLDTSDYLTEADRLYRKNGYQETAPFSDGRVANLWYAKTLR